MANNKSALKRIKINARNRAINKMYKLDMKRALKKYLAVVEEHRTTPTQETFSRVKFELSSTYQKLDKCVKVNLLHVNTAARKKAKLAKLMQVVNIENENASLPVIK